MTTYYQYDPDGWLTARVTGEREPVKSRQFTLRESIRTAHRKYNPATKEITTYKPTYRDDSEGNKEVTGLEVDTRVAKIDTTRKRR